MRLKVLGCEALARMVYSQAAVSPHVVDVEIYRLGLHVRPPELRTHLQERIDACQGQGYDALLLAYGLCGKATEGLTARDVPLVLPRAHDCITLFLGSRVRYTEEFSRDPGTYWYALDYVQRNDQPGAALSIGAGVTDDLPGVYAAYVEKYGQDNADYLMEVMGAWQKHYDRAAYVDMGVGDARAAEAQAQADAERRGWKFARLEGDLRLIRGLLSGAWDEDYLVIPPGHRIRMSSDEGVVRSEPAD